VEDAQAELAHNVQGRLVLAGGKGFVGQELARTLTGSREIVVLTRSAAPGNGEVRHAVWDGQNVGAWKQWLDGAHALVNLTGARIDCPHTPENRREILDSRVNSVRVLSKAVLECDRPPHVWVQASAVGYYGDTSPRISDEGSPPGEGFIAEVCKEWESAFQAAALPATRKVTLRLAPVLGREGGILPALSNITRLFLGGAAGSGEQYMSWIHIADLTTMFQWALDRDDLDGVFNASSPNPVQNSEFMRTLRRALHRPWTPRVPAWAVRLSAHIIGTDPNLILQGQRCTPKRFVDKGFTFQYPSLGSALEDLLTSKS